MKDEPTLKDLNKHIATLKKQNEVLQLQLLKYEEKLKQAKLESEKAIKHSHQLSTALDNLDTYVYIKNNQRRYLYANQKTLELFNCTAEELVGSSDNKFFPLETCKQLSRIDKKVLDHGENTAFEVESKDKEGNRLVYWEIKTPIYDKNNRNNIIGLCGISTDITERKIAEEKVKESEIQLKDINATKDKLFSIISHDLRILFGNVIGFSELIVEKEFEYDSAQFEKYAKIINSSAKNTIILLDNLLNWANTQTGALKFKSEKLDLSEVIFDILGLMNSLTKAKNISLNYSNKNKIEVFADENILKTILRNLISNAIKFTETGGIINVSATADKHLVKISISDDGIGMGKETIDTLFNISTNSTSPGTENEKGSGLGLILCKEFVEKLGGHIWVKSEKGKGSDFIFTLPISN